MTFSRGSVVCIHRGPWKQDVSVLVKHCSNDSYSSPGAWLVFFSVGLVVMLWDCLWCADMLPWFLLVKMRRLILCFCFSITVFLEDSLWFCSLKYPELEIWMIFLSLTSSCLSLFLFWLLLAYFSSFYYTFPPLSTFSVLPSFFHLLLLESGNVLFLHNRGWFTWLRASWLSFS